MHILYLMSSANIYGGTPKKTLDLIQRGNFNSSIYFWSDQYKEHHSKFRKAGATVYVGNYGRNFLRHIIKLLTILDKHNIDIIQTQFTMGETLGFFVKIFRPKMKLVVAFVSALKPSRFKRMALKLMYQKGDAFVYISKYVEQEKLKQYPLLKKKFSKVIYNGIPTRKDTGEKVINMKYSSILAISGLIELKNIKILVEALDIIINKKNKRNFFLYVAGDGPQKEELKLIIDKYGLNNHVFLIGYQNNVGRLLERCDLFVHPSYTEGFGIAVAEAMMEQKPIIVSNAGALPELIEGEKSGLVVDPHSAEGWAKAILKLINNNDYAGKLAKNAKKEAEKRFSIEEYRKNYESLYKLIKS